MSEASETFEDPNWKTPKKSSKREAVLHLIQDGKFRYVKMGLYGDSALIESFPIPRKKFLEEMEYNPNQIRKIFLEIADKFIEGEI